MSRGIGQRLRIYGPLGCVVALLLSVVSPLVALGLTTISQSYTTDSQIASGSIVSLKKESGDHVEAASISSVDSILGVAINADNALLSIDNSANNQVQVATSGIAQVLVSDINGSISQGDHITASGISGVGMKATGNVRIVGIAQDKLIGNKQTFKDKDGHMQTVLIGEVPVLVNVSYFFKQPDKTIIPATLQSVANAIAGKEVSPVPIFVSAAIFLVMLIIVASMIYSMIRSSIISVGRNPLSQSAVYRDLLQISGLVILILAVGLAAIYFTLSRLS
jgi:hypothetical protein